MIYLVDPAKAAVLGPIAGFALVAIILYLRR
jgi:hypothetical protein